MGNGFPNFSVLIAYSAHVNLERISCPQMVVQKSHVIKFIESYKHDSGLMA